jgi:hypothetical protein
MSDDNFVAVGLLTRRDLDVLGSGFRRAFLLEKNTDFTTLLDLIDEVDGKSRVGPPPRAH